MRPWQTRVFLPTPVTSGSLAAAGARPQGGLADRVRGLLLAALSGQLAACAVAVESGPPIVDPGDVASGLRRSEAYSRPALVRFDWKYADRRGNVGGQGVARYNPPDSLRVDLFTSGDVAMALALTGGELRSLGEIEDVEIPDLPFVYAMAGIFQPGPGVPDGYLAGGDSVLVYAGIDSRRTYFFVRHGLLRRVEEHRNGRTIQRVNLEWDSARTWPARAEYRNLLERSRVRWEVGGVTTQTESYPAQVFDLPPVP